jgi:hypothetical protein
MLIIVLAIVTALLETVLLQSLSSLVDASSFVLLLPEQSAAAETFFVYPRMPPDSCYKCLIVIHKPSRLEVEAVKASRLYFS